MNSDGGLSGLSVRRFSETDLTFYTVTVRLRGASTPPASCFLRLCQLPTLTDYKRRYGKSLCALSPTPVSSYG